ncbi:MULTISPECIES: hypothetical protein [Streptomyces]|jgi:hypothetical protein|uniref:hypothetical protein n=1 Tax=Streptomyces TaxID=1883 RepID=UPI000A374326|nr:hypothetical protein [Streptomyces glaucescens]
MSSRSGPDSAAEVVRWAAFSCVLVPVVLLWYGTSPAGAAGTALGLASVTAVCRLLLRQSERGAARLLAEEHAPHRGRHQRTGSGAHRGERSGGRPGGRPGGRTGGRSDGPGNTPVG